MGYILLKPASLPRYSENNHPALMFNLKLQYEPRLLLLILDVLSQSEH